MQPSGNAADYDERRRMWQLVFGIWVSIAASATSVFGFLSPTLKDAPYHWSQSDLALRSGITGVIINICALGTGALFDRWGPQHCLRLGAACVFVGLGLLALMLYGVLPLEWWSVVVVSVIYGQVDTLYESGSFVSNVATFSKDKGSVLIVEEGLGGAVLSALYTGFLHKNAHTMVVGITFIVPAIGLIASMVIRKPTAPEHSMPWHGPRRFLWAYVAVATTITVFSVTDLVQNFVDFDAPANVALASFAVIMTLSYVLLPFLWPQPYRDEGGPYGRNLSFVDSTATLREETLAAPFSAPQRTAIAENVPAKGVRFTEASSAGGAEGIASDMVSPLNAESAVTETALAAGPDETESELLLSPTPNDVGASFRVVLCKPEIYLLAIASIAQWGVADMIMANSPQIYRAVNHGHFDKHRNALYISIASIFNAVGRISVAVLDNYVENKLLLFTAAPVLLFAASAMTLAVPVEGLAFAYALNGMGRTWTWASRMLVTKQLFRGQDFGKIWNMLYLLGMWTPWAFNVGLFAGYYDHVAHDNGTYPHCNSPECVRVPLSVGMGVCAISVVAAVALLKLQAWRLRQSAVPIS